MISSPMASPSSWAVYLATTLASAAVLWALLGSPRRRKRLNQPPGPRPWPVVGSLHLVGRLPHQSFRDLSLQYGPIMQLYLGSQRLVVASSPAMAEQFLRTHDLVFANRPRRAAGKYTMYDFSDMLWSPCGPYWRHARKLFLLEIFSPQRLDSYEHIRMEELRRLVGKLASAASDSRTVALRDEISDFSLGVICRVVLGRTYTEQPPAPEKVVVSPEEFKKMLSELLLLNGVITIGDLIPWAGFLDIQGYVRRMKRLAKKADRFLERVLVEHEERRRRGKGTEFVSQDVVDVLTQVADDPGLDVKLTRDNIKALTLDLLTGAADSSAATVEWTMAELLRRPHILQKATEELDRVIGRERWVEEKDLQHLTYVEAIMKESMRLHPVAPLLAAHYSREDCNVAGYDIPAGTQVLVNTWAIGRDAAVWGGDADEFRPERFEGRATGRGFELLPFGAGRRMCPGHLLGIRMVQSSLANLLHGFRWRLPEGILPAPDEDNMEENFGLLVARKVPLELVVESRLPRRLYSF